MDNEKYTLPTDEQIVELAQKIIEEYKEALEGLA